jgi:uncharacterized protein (DUF2147 family)
MSKVLAAWILPICVIVSIPQAVAAVIEHPGVWLMGAKVAVQLFDCGDRLCGRVIWLKESIDSQGLLKRDKLNPDPTLRDRSVCGPTIIWNLHPADANHWEDGWFYNPDDGGTYRLKLEFQSADVVAARIFLGIPLFGETRTLTRIPVDTSAGWC